MSKLIRRLIWAFVAFLVVSVLLSRTITDWQWFDSLGYRPLLVVPWLWQIGVGAAVALVSFGVLYTSLLVARPSLAQAYLRPDLPVGLVGRPWQVVRRWSTWLVAGASVALGFGAAGRWMDVALFFHGRPFGLRDPILGQDVAFYVFTLPVVRLALSLLWGLVLLSAATAALIYGVAGILDWRRAGESLRGRPRRHLLTLLAALAVLWAAEIWVGRYVLLFTPHDVIFGVTYTDAHVRLPARAAASALALAAGILTVAAARGARGRYAAAAAIAALAVTAGAELVAGAVQQLVVRPNELAREEPFLRHHIEMTRRAFGLDRVRTVDFQPKDRLEPADLSAAAPLLREVRLWDWRPLGTVYGQLQKFRPYYDFVEVDVDRYLVEGRPRQVMLAVRELNTARLQNPSWINLRLQYTHGYGAVMSPVADVTVQGLPRLVMSDIPPRSEPGWPELRRPQVYFGELSTGWVVVNTRRPEFDYPSGDENVFFRYDGRDGIRLGWWNRLLFAARFGSPELLLSPEVGPQSRVLMYRSVMERIRRLMPYLRYDRDPYAVVTDDGRLVWMVDAYTTTDRFPYSRPVPGWGNYVRNSVKVTLDAYDGTVRFYLADEQDPVAAALSSLFGGFMRPMSEMPPDLRRHVRYPEDLFSVQAAVLTTYHMQSPVVFYNQEDRWDIAREIYGEDETVMQPYYAMVDLGDGPEFVLLLPFTAAGNQNMVAWMAARSDGARYGELLVFMMPKQRLTYGPMQIEARINQDPDISRELTLWSQRGSRVLRGNLIVIPVAGTILYVKPLFLVSERSQLPELRRVVVATQTQLTMAPDLASALRALTGQEPAVAAPAERAEAPPQSAEPAAGAGAEAQDTALRQSLRRALDTLEAARRQLTQGDWEAFGRSMQELQGILERLAGSSPGGR